jgi:hypothetical protein
MEVALVVSIENDTCAAAPEFSVGAFRSARDVPLGPAQTLMSGPPRPCDPVEQTIILNSSPHRLPSLLPTSHYAKLPAIHAVLTST